MSNTKRRDTLEALWAVVHPDHITAQEISEVCLTLDYRRDPETRHIAYTLSLELVSPGLRRLYNWDSLDDMFGHINSEDTEGTWQGLVVGLAATVTGIVLPGKE